MLSPRSFLEEGRRLLLAHDDDTLSLWGTDGARLAGPQPLKGRAIACGLLLDGKRVFAATSAGGLHLFDSAGLEPVATVAHGRSLAHAEPSEDGTLLLVADADHHVSAFSADRGDVAGETLTHQAAVTRILAPPAARGELVITAAADGVARLFDLRRGRLGAEYRHGAPVLDLGLGPGCLWTLGDDGLVQLFDMRGQDQPRGLALKHATAAISAGKLLLTGSRDGTIRAWKLPSGEEAWAEPLHAGAAVQAVRAAPAAGRGLVLTADGLVSIFAGDGAHLVATLRHEGGALAASFDPQGRLVATLGRDRFVRLWDAETGRPHGRPIRVGVEPARDPAPRPAPHIEARTITRIGQDRVVAVDGVLGLFTPIASGREAAMSEEEKRNLLAIVDQLRREVTDLQARNLKLEQELRTLRERPAAPEDFASGLQQSLDELQARMAAMRNATSNFAVRQIRLEAGVAVEVSPLGRIGYRFLQPGETIAPEAISRLSLELVPLPKETLAGVFSRDLFAPDRPLAVLPGMTADLLERFERAGLYAIGEYLQVGGRARAQVWLESFLGVERRRLAEWAQQALLLTLRGMTGPQALVLIRAGLGSFAALAAITPEALVARFAEERERAPPIDAPAPDPGTARMWQRGARQYLGLAEAADPPGSPVAPAPGDGSG